MCVCVCVYKYVFVCVFVCVCLRVSHPQLTVTGPRNHYERRLNIDVWPHDKPSTTQGPTNIAGLVQVQPHTINRQRLLVLRCERNQIRARSKRSQRAETESRLLD